MIKIHKYNCQCLWCGIELDPKVADKQRFKRYKTKKSTGATRHWCQDCKDKPVFIKKRKDKRCKRKYCYCKVRINWKELNNGK